MTDTPDIETPRPPSPRGAIPSISGPVAFCPEAYQRRAAVEERPAARIGNARTVGGVAIVPFVGFVYPGMLQSFLASCREAAADSSVTSIVIRGASPGGLVDGVPEAAAELRSLRGKKPVTFVADAYAASAAYWIASAADRIHVTPSGELGSIGVVWMHDDFSEYWEAMGIKTTVMRSSNAPYKVETTSEEPLSDGARAYQQGVLDDLEAMFIGDVAKYRGVRREVVVEKFGGGRMLLAKAALRAGLADAVMSLEQTIVAASKGQLGAGRRRAEADPETRGAVEMVSPLVGLSPAAARFRRR